MSMKKYCGCDNCGWVGFATHAFGNGTEFMCPECEAYDVIPVVVVPASSASGLIALERSRQIHEEGYTTAHDDVQRPYALSHAAVCYALSPHVRVQLRASEFWPLQKEMYKLKYARSNLIRAGALIAAELDKVIREEVEDERYWAEGY